MKRMGPVEFGIMKEIDSEMENLELQCICESVKSMKADIRGYQVQHGTKKMPSMLDRSKLSYRATNAIMRYKDQLYEKYSDADEKRKDFIIRYTQDYDKLVQLIMWAFRYFNNDRLAKKFLSLLYTINCIKYDRERWQKYTVNVDVLMDVINREELSDGLCPLRSISRKKLIQYSSKEELYNDLKEYGFQTEVFIQKICNLYINYIRDLEYKENIRKIKKLISTRKEIKEINDQRNKEEYDKAFKRFKNFIDASLNAFASCPVRFIPLYPARAQCVRIELPESERMRIVSSLMQSINNWKETRVKKRLPKKYSTLLDSINEEKLSTGYLGLCAHLSGQLVQMDIIWVLDDFDIYLSSIDTLNISIYPGSKRIWSLFMDVNKGFGKFKTFDEYSSKIEEIKYAYSIEANKVYAQRLK